MSNESSKAPAVTSPPCIWAIGTLETIAAIAQPNNSYLSPKITTTSGLFLLMTSLVILTDSAM